MMRRKNTSRRVHALSSDALRSDEIAATDMALSRDGSRDGVSDMRIGARWPEECRHGAVMTRRAAKINRPKGRSRFAVTAAPQDARLQSFKSRPRPCRGARKRASGDTTKWRS